MASTGAASGRPETSGKMVGMTPGSLVVMAASSLFGSPPGDAGAAALAPAAEAVEALERAQQLAPQPETLVALAAVYDGWEGHCKESIETYRTFFKSCGGCAALPLAVERFEATLSRCALDPTAEHELRENLLLRSPVRTEKQPGDATREEVAALLRDARAVDPAAVNELFLALVEAGSAASPAFLNDLRAKGWAVLGRRDATPGEVHTLLERLRSVDRQAHGTLFRRFSEMSLKDNATGLNLLRGELQERLAKSTTPPGGPESEDRVFCRTSPVAEFGFLTIDTKPWSEVYINGEARGATPLSNLKVNAGCSTVLVRERNSGKELLRNVDIRPNLVTRVFIDLDSGRERRSGPSPRD